MLWALLFFCAFFFFRCILFIKLIFVYLWCGCYHGH